MVSRDEWAKARWWVFFAKELPKIIQNAFPVSTGRLKLEVEDIYPDEIDHDYGLPIQLRLRLTNGWAGEIKEQEVRLGTAPVWAADGTFIFQGREFEPIDHSLHLDILEDNLRKAAKETAVIARHRMNTLDINTLTPAQLITRAQFEWALGSFFTSLEFREISRPERETRKFLKDHLPEVMSNLTPREQRILQLRYGLEDGVDRTLEEVGREFGITRERTRQIERKALERIMLQIVRGMLRQKTEKNKHPFGAVTTRKKGLSRPFVSCGVVQ